MAAHISSSAVSTVSYLSQLDMTLSALGGGLAVGAGVKISEALWIRRFYSGKKACQHPVLAVHRCQHPPSGNFTPLYRRVFKIGRYSG